MSMHYREVILRPKAFEDKIVYPDEARRLVSRLVGTAATPIFFCRYESGKTIGATQNGMPKQTPIIFDGGKGFIRIYGVGEEGVQALTDNLGLVMTALASDTKSPVAMELREGSLRFKPEFRVYKIRKLGIGKANKVRGQKFFALFERYLAATSDEAKTDIFQETLPLITEVVEKGIAAIGQEGLIDIPRDLDIHILGGELSCDKIHQDSAGRVGVVRNLRFSMVGDLVGPWAVGHLRSYGHGLIRREIQR